MWNLIKLLPELITLLVSVWSWVKKASGDDPAGLLSKVNEAFTGLSTVKTQEDHANAAKNLADLINQFPPK